MTNRSNSKPRSHARVRLSAWIRGNHATLPCSCPPGQRYRCLGNGRVMCADRELVVADMRRELEALDVTGSLAAADRRQAAEKAVVDAFKARLVEAMAASLGMDVVNMGWVAEFIRDQE